MIGKFIDMGIINTYDLMTGKRQFEEIVKEEELPIFFINPEEKCDNEDLDTMIDYFVSTEEYEKCIVLTKLKK
tara:strand:- start:99 stop:317 length:219 start_codon:yes stop_codon:yes gene_type:complete